MRSWFSSRSGGWRGLRARLHRFLLSEDGITPMEWVALAGVAMIMGVVMTWIVTHNMSSTADFIESNVNSAASQ
jgi:hypothetical protein